ncbi:hypothetical protein BD779DRAFT_1544035 [Infundibulicybe gibba]|nr:hypothetical protein BD779DRAFT_1544035 [Infundibulicybe gibba]
MELKLVYRILRKISDWTLAGFYSEVYVEGQENVMKDGPLIVAASHHNEIIDIATLAATMTYRRHLYFWAKSTMFTNPLLGAILSSSGAIPVRRNPNNALPPPIPTSAPGASGATNAKSGGGTDAAAQGQSALFHDSSKALEQGRVIGVFPEGTSYTEPSIVQVMPGAARAAVEFVCWNDSVQHSRGGDLAIVPVGIVYTDKSRYQSRVCVRYGAPIHVSASTIHDLPGRDQERAIRETVKQITAQIEQQLVSMTINAPDWKTLRAAQMARGILWGGDENIALKDWVGVSQTLVNLLSTSQNTGDSASAAQAALTKYYSLLHYSGINHSTLHSLIPLALQPDSCTPLISSTPVLPSFVLAFLVSAVKAIPFLPPLLFHLPGYVSGPLLARCFAPPNEEEARAQFKAVGGGFGLGVSIAGFFGAAKVLEKHANLGALVDTSLRRTAVTLGLVYISTYILLKWHALLVGGNYTRIKRLWTLYKLSVGLRPGSDPLSVEELDAYTRPPTPAVNPYIKKPSPSAADSAPETVPTPPPSRRLIRHLLGARADAYAALRALVDERRKHNDARVEYLEKMGVRLA